ncbi:MAG: MurR/RpiR family transcriptional regulator [Synergistaceae bacterium]|nr:MurR/RpiR family transcriptional regulator [Synergistaceae bacterium]
MAENDIFDRIRLKLSTFSRSNKKIARFFISEYERAARMNSYEIAGELGISPATVGRFAVALGYAGVGEMFHDLRDGAFRIAHGPMKKLRESILQNEQPEEILRKVVQHEIDGLKFDMFEQMNQPFIRTVRAMIDADRIFLVAARSSFCVAHYGAALLSSASKNVFCVPSSAEDRYERMEDLSTRDVVIAISYHRYYKDTVDLMRYAGKSDAFAVGVTDSVFSPLAPFCREILLVPNQCPFTSYVPVMVLMDALILAFTQARAEQVDEILERRIKILMENGAYTEGDGKEEFGEEK